ncbi:hypothetical protein [Burkholderia glumae]|uniref:Uncharacterized protein n=1 Tax=Burkholderia glumae TaxID=337 RepID=A0AAP9Y4Z9_BURGL|nr:hypothetical protein [Burkholderia glumae]MCM2485611.1 hypothetical protein [Burkholderia glumae]MCM2496020.1 hypothetical protein [Burkholderia glumae]MCM2511517.1 hypothetical protein [Burkholderia glumae]MCM2541728.1 hypothetical protein [Burkholderia glumae]MCM2552693.1 hypothetical protein [Burkholderia glumae]
MDRDPRRAQRAYRREAERLLLWAIVAKGKPLSSLNTPVRGGQRIAQYRGQRTLCAAACHAGYRKLAEFCGRVA